ncbi:MAG: hypothetical protein KC563_03550, partial [Nitrospira sp.]|nr:hypothetical protein [Nitrospira sp.]MCA9479313.1 hypothetical protein [Nitrospira sp.]
GVEAAGEAEAMSPGMITRVTKQGLWVKTGQGELSILELQPANKKRLDVAHFLAGHHLEAGMKLSSGPGRRSA